jgi:hypothetical protein
MNEVSGAKKSIFGNMGSEMDMEDVNQGGNGSGRLLDPANDNNDMDVV